MRREAHDTEQLQKVQADRGYGRKRGALTTTTTPAYPVQSHAIWSPAPGSHPPPCWGREASDREKLAFACATLRRYGITAAPAQHGSPGAIAARLTDLIRSRFPSADGACVFWTAEDQARCLGPAGRLEERLAVHVYGPGALEAAAAAFAAAGLGVGPGAAAGVLSVGGPAEAQP